MEITVLNEYFKELKMCASSIHVFLSFDSDDAISKAADRLGSQ